MNCLVFACCIALSMANAYPWINYGYTIRGQGVNSVVIKGGSTAANIAGPDGSFITSLANAGAIGSPITDGHITQTVPFIPSTPEYSNSMSSHTYSLPYSSHLHGTRKVIINGPSGTIIASDPSYNPYVPIHLRAW